MDRNEAPADALQRAIDIFGNQADLAKAIGVSQTTVSYWLRAARRGVPADCAISIERATKRKVRREELRPDLFASRRSAA